jgi:hypothetical protein
MTRVIGYILAIAIGVSLGLIGGGGSILAVPILIYVMGISSKTAIAMSLFIVGLVSLVGAIPHWQKGNVNLKMAIVFAPMAMLGSYTGAKITALPWITDTFQLISFGVVMVIASVLMIRQGGQKKEILAIEKPSTKKSFPWLTILISGLGTGIITGFVGVGGGFLIVPALVLLAGVPMKKAIGTSLLIILAQSTTGFIGYLNQVEVNWQIAIVFTIFASIGTFMGAYFNQFIDAKNLQKGFGYFVLAVATFVLIKQ